MRKLLYTGRGAAHVAGTRRMVNAVCWESLKKKLRQSWEKCVQADVKWGREGTTGFIWPGGGGAVFVISSVTTFYILRGTTRFSQNQLTNTRLFVKICYIKHYHLRAVKNCITLNSQESLTVTKYQ